jgi:simple sugar transport system substrate-binding protein
MLAGGDPGAQVVVPPTLITQDFLNEADISNMEDLSSAMPQFQHADVAMTDWMPSRMARTASPIASPARSRLPPSR